MPKRKYEESKEDRWRRKLKDYKRKLNKKKRRISIHSDSHSEDNLDGRITSQSPPLSIQRSPSPSPLATTPPPVAPPTVIQPPTDVEPQGLPDTQMLANQTLTPDTQTDAPSADPELLQALGDMEAEVNEWGPDIVSDLSKRWEPILRDGLKNEIKEDLFKKYITPKNCPLMKPPVLNPEIAAVLTDSAKNRDGRILKKQGQLGCALAILGKSMTGILTKSLETSEILRCLTDASKLLADSHFAETETRRSLITPMVDKTFIEPFKDRKRDSHLFGEKLSDFIRSSRGIKKTGQLIQSTAASSSSNLNWRGPSRQQHQPGSRTYSSRGGPKANQFYRQRAPPAPPVRGRRAPVTPPPALARSTAPRRGGRAAVTSSRQK